MLTIAPHYIEGIKACVDHVQLRRYLQNAIELEHATIPPYLTAMFSLKPGYNEAIKKLIHGIVVQEMKHMTIAANVLIAIGGKPALNDPKFVPNYPGGLPMQIGGENFKVPIARFSRELVNKVFMHIEAPVHPMPIQDNPCQVEAPTATHEFKTIGEFYHAIQQKIRELSEHENIFTVGEDQQVLSWFDLFPIVDAESACNAIDIIIDEGEGSDKTPYENPDAPKPVLSHYYMFGEICAGKQLIYNYDEHGKKYYAYAGASIDFKPEGVYPIKENAKLENYPVGSKARVLAEQYAYSYSSLLNALHESFNGAPDTIKAAIGLMYELDLQAKMLMSTPLNDGSGDTVGPVYVQIARRTGYEKAA